MQKCGLKMSEVSKITGQTPLQPDFEALSYAKMPNYIEEQ
jgi:hypothetical protein